MSVEGGARLGNLLDGSDLYALKHVSPSTTSRAWHANDEFHSRQQSTDHEHRIQQAGNVTVYFFYSSALSYISVSPVVEVADSPLDVGKWLVGADKNREMLWQENWHGCCLHQSVKIMLWGEAYWQWSEARVLWDGNDVSKGWRPTLKAKSSMKLGRDNRHSRWNSRELWNERSVWVV